MQNTNLVSYLWHLSFFLLWIVGILCAHNWLSKERITINWPSHTMRTKVTLLWNLQIMSTCTTSTQYCLLHQGSLCKSINPPLALKHEKKPNCYGIVILTCVSWNINWLIERVFCFLMIRRPVLKSVQIFTLTPKHLKHLRVF